MNSPMLPPMEPEFQMTSPMGEPEMPQVSGFSVPRLLMFLQKFWWLPIVMLAVGAGLGVALVRQRPPTYVSKAHLLQNMVTRIAEAGIVADDPATFLGTQVELLQSEPMRDMALARMSTHGIAIAKGKDGLPMPVTVRAGQAKNSSIYELSATSSQAAYVQAYLDALVNVYLEFKKTLRKTVTGQTLAEVTNLAENAERDLKSNQDALLNFQRSNNIVNIQQQVAQYGTHLMSLQTQLSDFQLDERFQNAYLNHLNDPGANPLPPGATNTTGTNIDLNATNSNGYLSSTATPEQELELLQTRRDKLSVNLRPKHPKIVKLDEDIDREKKIIEISRRQHRDELVSTLNNLRRKMDGLTNAIKEWEPKVLQANRLMADADELKLNVDRTRAKVDKFNAMVESLETGRNIDTDTMTILDPASVASRTFTDETTIIAGSSMGGLALGVGIVLLLVFRDDRFVSMKEIVDKFGDRIVGQLPQMEGVKRNTRVPLLTLNDDRHIYAESYRSLRSALLFLADNGVRPKVLLITSAVPNEGKSTVAANLARTMALGGSSVLLVDADMRRGALHEAMGLKKEPGLADLLRNTGDVNGIIQQDSLPKLHFIARGSIEGHPGDLFLSDIFEKLLASWREKYDYVVIDSSPVFAADDATTLAPMVDGTLFVVRSRFSRAEPVREALSLLAQRQARILGMIVNGADVTDRSYHYYKHADYYLPAKTA